MLFWSYVVGVVAIAALGVGLFSSRLPVKAAAQRPADLSWSCSPVPERLRCQGPVGPGVVSWHWSIDGDMVAAAHPLLDLAVRPGPHNVGLVIVSPAGSYSTRLHHVVIDNTPEADRETPR